MLKKAVAIPKKSKCLEIFGLPDGEKIYSQILSAEFRNAKLLKEQIENIKKGSYLASVTNICKLLDISKRSYYNAINDVLVFDHLNCIPPSRQLLTNSEENFLITEILRHQIDKDCLTGQDIRDLAESLYEERTGLTRSFNRDWCRDFKTRNSDRIEKVKAGCLEDDRASIDPAQIERYILAIENMLQDPPPPELILNFDETGFSRRPQKGKRKSVFISKNCQVSPYWRENSELHHISLVTCITAACSSLRPLLLSTRIRMDKDISKTFFESWASHFTTKKGYMTQKSMEFWLQNIVAPYVKEVRNKLNANHKCVIICDSCSSHFSDEVSDILKEIGNIEIIPIPPHSSHFTQMLDATIFGSLKRKYSSTPNDSSLTSRFTKKLIRIKKAYESTMSQELIKSGWEATGFKINLEKGKVTSVSFKEEFKTRLRSESKKT